MLARFTDFDTASAGPRVTVVVAISLWIRALPLNMAGTRAVLTMSKPVVPGLAGSPASIAACVRS